MRKTGYQIIDLKDKAITTNGAGVTIAGSYDAVKNPYRKMIVISRLKLDNVLLPDIPAVFDCPVAGGAYYATIRTSWVSETQVTAFIIQISNANTVSVHSAIISI